MELRLMRGVYRAQIRKRRKNRLIENWGGKRIRRCLWKKSRLKAKPEFLLEHLLKHGVMLIGGGAENAATTAVRRLTQHQRAKDRQLTIIETQQSLKNTEF